MHRGKGRHATGPGRRRFLIAGGEGFSKVEKVLCKRGEGFYIGFYRWRRFSGRFSFKILKEKSPETFSAQDGQDGRAEGLRWEVEPP